jgi:hypothetical protein
VKLIVLNCFFCTSNAALVEILIVSCVDDAILLLV